MKKRILVWDIPTRICHWLLAISIGYSWFTVEILEDMEQHFWAGYAVLSLVLFRVIWGFIGSRYARFANFLFPLRNIIHYAKTLPSANSKAYLGHNPLGSLSIFAMLLIIGLQVATGLFNSDDYFFGPLNSLAEAGIVKLFSQIHEINFDVITVVVVLHVLAIIFYRLRKKQKLVSAMITGKKESTDNSAQAITSSRLILAALVMAICLSAVYLLVTFAPETAVAEDYYY